VSGADAAGLLLAAGAGRRMGGPKALLRHADGTPFLDRAVVTLLDGGCASVTVVLGAAADQARALLDETGWSGDDRVAVVHAPDWDEGMGASLRAGLAMLRASPASCALVSLVDLPDVDARVVRRVLGVLDAASGPLALARASYQGRPGHPVLIGREHWSGVLSSAHGDRGARGYLETHDVILRECGDLATGRDLDRPEDLHA
jgi:CTP:molybdopterin cytidylyltransferase MocA